EITTEHFLPAAKSSQNGGCGDGKTRSGRGCAREPSDTLLIFFVFCTLASSNRETSLSRNADCLGRTFCEQSTWSPARPSKRLRASFTQSVTRPHRYPAW